MSAFSKIERAVHDIAPSVEVTVEKNCIVLRGELENWDDVVACGRAAVSKKYYGVVNDIRLKGFEQKIKLPKVNDKAYDGLKPDVLIIGGGISGASIAHELSKWQLDVMLVEKDYDVATGATSRNDGCVHVGIDLTPSLVKHSYLVKGNAMYDDLCRDMDVKFERSGHMMLMYYKWERLLMPVVKIWSKILEIKGMRYINREELLKIEPEAVEWAKGAYYMPSGGIVSPYKLTVALAEHAAENGVHICLNTAVLGMTVEDGEIKSVETNRGTIYPKLVVNAAGTYADVIADMAGDRTFTIHPRKGIDVILDKKKGNAAHTSISKMPFVHVPDDWKNKSGNESFFKTILKGKKLNETQKTHTKGGGVIHTVDNNVLLGPNAIEVPDREDYTTDIESIDSIIKKQRIIQDKVGKGDVITYFAGERPATYEEDFVVRRGIFTKNIIEVAGIQSPGITTAPAVAKDVEKWAIVYLGRQNKVKVNQNYNPVHKSAPHLAGMSEEERDKLIKRNPAYGEIVCRCEEISKGEILDAVRSAVPVFTLDAIKRRVRPGMGRCQGGFCGPAVQKILAEEKGCPIEEITKGNDYSVILFDKTKKGAKENV